MRICVRSHRADTCFRRLAAFRERLRSSGVLRIAPGGTRQGLMLRRSALRSDSTAVRAPGSCRITRYALRATLGQMRQFSSRSALARADPGAVLLVAAEIAPVGYRPTRSRDLGCWGPNTMSAAAKRRGLPRAGFAATINPHAFRKVGQRCTPKAPNGPVGLNANPYEPPVRQAKHRAKDLLFGSSRHAATAMIDAPLGPRGAASCRPARAN